MKEAKVIEGWKQTLPLPPYHLPAPEQVPWEELGTTTCKATTPDTARPGRVPAWRPVGVC